MLNEKLDVRIKSVCFADTQSTAKTKLKNSSVFRKCCQKRYT